MNILALMVTLIFLLGYGTFAVHFWKCGYKKTAVYTLGFAVAVVSLGVKVLS